MKRKTSYHILVNGHLSFKPTRIENARRIVEHFLWMKSDVACWKETETNNSFTTERMYRGGDEYPLNAMKVNQPPENEMIKEQSNG